MTNKRPLNQNTPNQSGFTIVELMIATAVFSVILIVLTFGILQISNAYYKSITTTNTQNVARNVINEVSQSIQFSGGPVLSIQSTTGSGSAISQGYCIGNQLYSYLVGYQLEDSGFNSSLYQSPHALTINSVSGCSSSTQAQDLTGSTFATPVQELLSPNMRLTYFNITQLSPILYNVNVRIVYGSLDLLTVTTPNPIWNQFTTCSPGEGQQFCAVSELSTVVEKRVQ